MSTPEPQPLDQNGNPIAPPADQQSPLGPDGTPLVPGTPDSQIVADRADAPAVVRTDALNQIADDLQKVITELGQDLSAAVQSDEKSHRLEGIALRVALDALQGAHRVIANYQEPSTGPAVSSGVVGSS